VFLFSSRKEKSGSEIVITMREYVLGSFLNELSEINKKLPNKIDGYTTLNIIKYEDKKIVSIYELASNDISVDLLEKIKPLIKKQACKDEMKKNLLEVDIDFLDRYQNPTGDILFEVTISKSECAQF
jgi:myo-inositol-1-phosphate synthase